MTERAETASNCLRIELTAKGHEEFFRVMKTFCILNVMPVTQLHIIAAIHQTIQLVNFLYVIKLGKIYFFPDYKKELFNTKFF